MSTATTLAHGHMVDQVKAASAIQAGLAVNFERTLNPRDLDGTFPTYLRSSLALIAGGRKHSTALATSYYGAAKRGAGYDAVIPALGAPAWDLQAAATDLLVNGPVSVKTYLKNGNSLSHALEVAKAKTLNAGKRHVLNAGRQTVLNLASKDTDALGWARVSDGQPCAFCAMLVSRGPVYKEQTAFFRAHNGCGCSARPFFKGEADGGWSPDARALSQLAESNGATGSVNLFRAAYNAAVLDPDSDVFKALTDKVAGQIAQPGIVAARKKALDAYQTAQAARLAAEKVAREAASKAAREAAEKLAKEEAKKAALVKKWLGKPAPVAPKKPLPPATLGPAAYDEWLQKVKERYTAFAKSTGNPKSDLTKSHNWSLVERVFKENDLDALAQLKAMHYVDDALYADAVAASKKATTPLPGAMAAYEKELRSYRNRSTRHKRYLQEWADVNGVQPSNAKGMNGALRHKTNAAGMRYAREKLHLVPDHTVERAALKKYSGESYTPWNDALRANADRTTRPRAWDRDTLNADKGFAPLPEDLIVHRGTSFMEFDFGGTVGRVGNAPPPDPRDLIGTVHTQHGYMSTSVGDRAAFDYKPVQMKVRVPEGHGHSFIDPYSRNPGERELLLERGTNFFIHDVYKSPDGRKWIVEAEVIPMTDDAASWVSTVTPTPSESKYTY